MTLFRKPPPPPKRRLDVDPNELRKERRRDVTKEAPPYRAELNGRMTPVRNISRGGFSVDVAHRDAPQRATVTIYRGEGVFLRAVAVLAWWRDQRAGYQILETLASTDRQSPSAEIPRYPRPPQRRSTSITARPPGPGPRSRLRRD